jgi:phage-related protein
MPEVVIFAEEDGSAPLVDWLDEQPQKAQDKCIVRVERLKELGHALRRPEADTLRDGIHELRVCSNGINYRMLYFFSGQRAVLSHGFTKQTDRVPDKEINLAIERKAKFERDPVKYTHHVSD